jgi:hypothetical protein
VEQRRTPKRGRRRGLGALFLVLAVGFAGIAFAALSSDAGQARRIVVALGAAALAVWLATLAARALR